MIQVDSSLLALSKLCQAAVKAETQQIKNKYLIHTLNVNS
jgi:hypothetical protein